MERTTLVVARILVFLNIPPAPLAHLMYLNSAAKCAKSALAPSKFLMAKPCLATASWSFNWVSAYRVSLVGYLGTFDTSMLAFWTVK